MKTRRGFTLLETVVTLSILAICFALTMGVIAALTNIQKASSLQTSIDTQLDDVDKTVQEYVSLVSINVGDKNYSYNDENSNAGTVCFVATSKSYYLNFLDHSISITCLENDMTTTIIEKALKDINSVVFSYDVSLKMLIADVSVDSENLRYVYTIRTDH